MSTYEIKFDRRTEDNIKTLHPLAREKARDFIYNATIFLREKDPDVTVKIISGTRSYAEQDELYAQGRTKPGQRVTNAPGGFSNHNFGVAFDVGLFRGKDYLEESPLYRDLGPVGEAVGLEWGGRWQRFVDFPHFELRPSWAKRLKSSEMLLAFRRKTAQGEDLFA